MRVEELKARLSLTIRDVLTWYSNTGTFQHAQIRLSGKEKLNTQKKMSK